MINFQFFLIPALCALGPLSSSFNNNQFVSAFTHSPWTKLPHTFVNRKTNDNVKNSFLMSSPPDSGEMDFDEMHPLEPLKENEVRHERLQKEQALQNKYAQDSDLVECRSRVTQLKTEYLSAKSNRDYHTMNILEEQIRYERSRDAEFVYSQALNAFRIATVEGRKDAADKFFKVAICAKSCLPQFNLEGLWVGKYGSQGYEMINVTYAANTLIAYKVTGDKSVPKGEITFRADLTPNFNAVLEPIELSRDASKQWGVKHLARFPGEGQIASEGYADNEWIEGQLLVIGEYFSFAWTPLGHRIFFGRPSPELTLKLMKKDSQVSSTRSEDISVTRMREQANRILEETIIVLEEDKEDSSQIYSSSLGGVDKSEIGDDCFQ